MKNTFVIVADLGMFKAYKFDRTAIQQTPRLELVEELESIDAHGKFTDKVTDQAGRWRMPMSRMAMSYGERQKIDLEMRRRLVKQLAANIQRVLAEHLVEECYMSVNKEVHHQLWDELDARTRNRISKVIPADLTKLDKTEIVEHFAGAVA